MVLSSAKKISETAPSAVIVGGEEAIYDNRAARSRL